MDPKAFNAIYKGKAKKIHGSFTMGFNVEGESCITKAANNLKTFGAQFRIKPVQQLKTDSTMAFFGIPNSADPSSVKDLVDDVVQPLKKELMK